LNLILSAEDCNPYLNLIVFVNCKPYLNLILSYIIVTVILTEVLAVWLSPEVYFAVIE